ncbi:MAG TPA: hypothetical protein VG319_11390 [Polyangia bacterium]|jgi:hypothetical protein|nr:hypothetical protein [Polyangia bacterium]
MRHLSNAVGRASRARVRITSRVAARAALASALGLLAACSGSTGRSGTIGAAGASAGSSGGAQGGSTGGAAGSGGAGTGAGGQIAGAAGTTGAAGSGGASTAGAGGGGPDGSAGSAGADGGSDAGAASLTLPIMRANGLYVLEMGGLSFTVNPMVGARIISFKLDGDELLTDATANAMFWGSTLWTSPASDWLLSGPFAAPPIVDSNPYTATVSADGVITATSALSTTINMPPKRFVITKVFHADLVNRAIVIDYKITNMATAAFNLSHWEVTRVFPNGLTFFPTGALTKLDYLAQPAKVTQALGYTWYDNSKHTVGTESKAGTDSQGGFIAHVAPHAAGDLLFIKAFNPVTQAQGPPGENPIEWYCNAPHTYVELEDHSPYDSIPAGATSTRTVTWYLRRLPAGDHTAGSATLIAAVQSALGKN